MNKYINNFINLFSNDNNTIYKAILEKKDWILDEYYIELDFVPSKVDGLDVYPKVFALLDGGVYMNPCILEDDKENMLVSINSYLDLFAKDHIPFKKGHFYVGLNFKRIEDNVYKELCANFYPKFDEGEFDKTDDELINAFAKFMYGKNGEYVLLLSNSLLMRQVYPLEIAFEVVYKKDTLTSYQVEALNDFATRMHISLREVNDD